nr:D-aminoacyl-tRNA deacylase 1-like [Oryctolagus cuniculus]
MRTSSVTTVAFLGLTGNGMLVPGDFYDGQAGFVYWSPSRRHEGRGAARHPGQRHRVRKILNLRVFEDESGKHWSKSVMDKQHEVLCVSQFTLQCVLKGSKPDFHLKAMPSEQAEGFYNSFLEQLRKAYWPELIKDGKFGAYMQVHIQNDGPVTIELESPAPGAAASDPKQLSKLEKQQQRKEKTRAKGPSESSKERPAPRKENRSASSWAEGDVSSEREP